MIRVDVRKFTECTNCPVATSALTELAIEFRKKRQPKDIVATHCNPELHPLIGGNILKLICMVTDEGRLERLTPMLGKDEYFTADGMFVEEPATCPHLVNEISNGILKKLHLR